MEKKCFNCEHMAFCQMYNSMQNIAMLLNVNMRVNDLNESGFVVMVNEMAHGCLRFERVKGE